MIRPFISLSNVALDHHHARTIVRRRAFTLAELLVVMAIILIIMGGILPVLKGPLDGVNLVGSADNITSVFTLARQTAMSRNLSTEVRIYQQNNGLTRKDWNLVALVIPSTVSNANIDEWIGTPTALSGNVIIDAGKSSQAGTDDPAFSTLISIAQNSKLTDANPNPTPPWSATEKPAAPFILRNLPYVAFRFLPDGSTNLPAMYPSPNSAQRYHWCLSLRNYTAATASGGAVPAANYVSLVIDPSTGRVLTFRP